MRWLPFPNNVIFASLTRTNQSNTIFAIVFKLGGREDGPHLACMNFMGLEMTTMIVLTGSKLCLGKGLLREMAKNIKIGHLL